MELRHLRYFVAVAEEENVTRAAERLRISQPSLSRQILDLEEELQLPLFEHNGRSVRLTESGRVFLSEARAVLERVADAVKTAKAVSSGQEEELHVGYAPSLTIKLLPRALRLFQEDASGVRVVLHDFSTEEMLNGLREGELCLALLKRPSNKSLHGLAFEELQRFPVCAAMHLTHRLASAHILSLQSLAGERIIGYSRIEYPEYHEWLTSLFIPLTPPRIVEEHDSSTSLIAAVEAGRGVALIQQGFEDLAGPRLKVRALDPAPDPVVVGFARRKGKLSSVAERFIAALKRSS